jgi:hypothetical protein
VTGGDHQRDGDGRGEASGRAREARTGGEQERSTAETVVAAFSVVFTLVLLGFVAWHAWTVPAAENPQARVTATSPHPGGGVEATVELRNDQDVGVVSATVEVSCGSPPPEVTFTNVPAGGRTTATVVCPLGTANPTASVQSWQEP